MECGESSGVRDLCGRSVLASSGDGDASGHLRGRRHNYVVVCRCDQCDERFQSAAAATALRNQVISHLSSEALGPFKAQQNEVHASGPGKR